MTRNRLLWMLSGIVLLVAGVAGILASRGRFAVEPDTTLLAPDAGATWRQWGAWASLAAAALGVILMACGILLLRSLLRRPRVTLMNAAEASVDASTDEDARRGVTRVATSTLEGALAKDLRRDSDIEEASVSMAAGSSQPLLWLRLTLRPGADVPVAHTKVGLALERFTRTSGLHPTLADVEVKAPTMRRPTPARVK